MSPLIDVRFGKILPLPIHAVAALGLFFVLIAFHDKPIATGVVVILALAVFTASEGTEIDPRARKYREYHSLFFVRGGEWVTYNAIEKLYVNRNRMKQRMYATMSNKSSEIISYEYTVFVKFDDDERIQLKKGKNKDALLKLADSWSKQLQVPVINNTGESD